MVRWILALDFLEKGFILYFYFYFFFAQFKNQKNSKYNLKTCDTSFNYAICSLGKYVQFH